ncbi:uncharacterized protein LOC143018011 [Oratosquilla oratoria]|uniref:uncharacterized protein LOC143018011 n=1 Tax=Oratosquilla oratoria TaxID=337810 RepID=UPI003F763059
MYRSKVNVFGPKFEFDVMRTDLSSTESEFYDVGKRLSMNNIDKKQDILHTRNMKMEVNFRNNTKSLPRIRKTTIGRSPFLSQREKSMTQIKCSICSKTFLCNNPTKNCLCLLCSRKAELLLKCIERKECELCLTMCTFLLHGRFCVSCKARRLNTTAKHRSYRPVIRFCRYCAQKELLTGNTVDYICSTCSTLIRLFTDNFSSYKRCIYFDFLYAFTSSSEDEDSSCWFCASHLHKETSKTIYVIKTVLKKNEVGNKISWDYNKSNSRTVECRCESTLSPRCIENTPGSKSKRKKCKTNEKEILKEWNTAQNISLYSLGCDGKTKKDWTGAKQEKDKHYSRGRGNSLKEPLAKRKSTREGQKSSRKTVAYIDKEYIPRGGTRRRKSRIVLEKEPHPDAHGTRETLNTETARLTEVKKGNMSALSTDEEITDMHPVVTLDGDIIMEIPMDILENADFLKLSNDINIEDIQDFTGEDSNPIIGTCTDVAVRDWKQTLPGEVENSVIQELTNDCKSYTASLDKNGGSETDIYNHTNADRHTFFNVCERNDTQALNCGSQNIDTETLTRDSRTETQEMLKLCETSDAQTSSTHLFKDINLGSLLADILKQTSSLWDPSMQSHVNDKNDPLVHKEFSNNDSAFEVEKQGEIKTDKCHTGNALVYKHVDGMSNKYTDHVSSTSVYSVLQGMVPAVSTYEAASPLQGPGIENASIAGCHANTYTKKNIVTHFPSSICINTHTTVATKTYYQNSNVCGTNEGHSGWDTCAKYSTVVTPVDPSVSGHDPLSGANTGDKKSDLGSCIREKGPVVNKPMNWTPTYQLLTPSIVPDPSTGNRLPEVQDELQCAENSSGPHPSRCTGRESRDADSDINVCSLSESDLTLSKTMACTGRDDSGTSPKSEEVYREYARLLRNPQTLRCRGCSNWLTWFESCRGNVCFMCAERLRKIQATESSSVCEKCVNTLRPRDHFHLGIICKTCFSLVQKSRRNPVRCESCNKKLSNNEVDDGSFCLQCLDRLDDLKYLHGAQVRACVGCNRKFGSLDVHDTYCSFCKIHVLYNFKDKSRIHNFCWHCQTMCMVNNSNVLVLCQPCLGLFSHLEFYLSRYVKCLFCGRMFLIKAHLGKGTCGKCKRKRRTKPAIQYKKQSRDASHPLPK